MCLASVVGLLLSYKLWLSARTFPLSPVTTALPMIPFPFDTLIFILLILLLTIIFFSNTPRKYLLVFISLLLLDCLEDQLRWQPWVYQYLLMFTVLSFFPWQLKKPGNQEEIINTFRIIIASIYIYSGIQKLNVLFLTSVWPWLATPISHLLPFIPWQILYAVGNIIPLVETSIGIFLLIPKTRKIAVWLAIAMHLFILFSLGPLGRNWNSVVWPWNIAMIGFVWTLFWDTQKITFKDIFKRNKFAFKYVVILLFGILPILNLFNLYDSYLSDALYSGNTSSAYMVLGKDHHQLDFNTWALSELNVPVYPADRIFLNIGRKVCAELSASGDSKLVILDKANIGGISKMKIYTCKDLITLKRKHQQIFLVSATAENW